MNGILSLPRCISIVMYPGSTSPLCIFCPMSHVATSTVQIEWPARVFPDYLIQFIIFTELAFPRKFTTELTFINSPPCSAPEPFYNIAEISAQRVNWTFPDGKPQRGRTIGEPFSWSSSVLSLISN